MSFTFVQAQEEDRAYLLALRKLTMIPHLEKSGQFLSDEEHIFRLNDAYACSYLILWQREPIGTLKYQESNDCLEIMQLQIHPAFQGRGLGRNVLKHLLTQTESKVVELTVLKENPALRLYQRLGFSITGEDQYEFFMRLHLSNNSKQGI